MKVKVKVKAEVQGKVKVKVEVKVKAKLHLKWKESKGENESKVKTSISDESIDSEGGILHYFTCFPFHECMFSQIRVVAATFCDHSRRAGAASSAPRVGNKGGPRRRRRRTPTAVGLVTPPEALKSQESLNEK